MKIIIFTVFIFCEFFSGIVCGKLRRIRNAALVGETIVSVDSNNQDTLKANLFFCQNYKAPDFHFSKAKCYRIYQFQIAANATFDCYARNLLIIFTIPEVDSDNKFVANREVYGYLEQHTMLNEHYGVVIVDQEFGTECQRLKE
jgi:hypothetical protein